jgi:predicted RNA-binding protein associated with RNAse of E/G family
MGVIRLNKRQIIEKKILEKVDLLIEIILSLEMSEEQEKEVYLEKGSVLVNEFSDLLAELIGPNEEYIKDAMKELIIQRMPNYNFENGMEDINNIIEGFNQRDRNAADEPSVSQAAPIMNPLQKAIKYHFSQFKIVENYRHQGHFFSYYIPSLKVAVDDCSSLDTYPVRKEYICRQMGIKLIPVGRDLSCSREIIREIKRRLDTDTTL